MREAPAGRVFLVTRHAGTRDLLLPLLAGDGSRVDIRDHLDPDEVQPGDTVIGTLPLALAAAVEAKGAAFWSFTFDRYREDRGQNLSAATLRTRNPRLERYRVELRAVRVAGLGSLRAVDSA